MGDTTAAMPLVPDSCDGNAENATGAYGVHEKPGFTEMWREAMASGDALGGSHG